MTKFTQAGIRYFFSHRALLFCSSLLLIATMGIFGCSDDEGNPCDNDSACIKVVVPATTNSAEQTFWRSAQGRVCPCEE